jgi:hypothetical protein
MAKIFTNTRCVYCLQFFKNLTLDHVFPKSWYPDTTPENLRKMQVPACDECNQKFRKIEDEFLQNIRMCHNEQRIIPISPENIELLAEKLVRGVTYDKRTTYIDSNRNVEIIFVPAENVEPMLNNFVGAQDCCCSGINILMVFADDDPQNGAFFIELWKQFYIYVRVLTREENAGKTVATSKPRTPIEITKQIVTLCKEIDKSQTPYHVPVKPESWVESKECFFNVKTKVEKDGGHPQFGWTIWETPNFMIEAEFHAIWISPENESIDITPNQINSKSILFLPDSTRKYDYNREFYRVDNIRHPLSNNPLIIDLIKLNEEIFACEEKYFPGREINPENPAFAPWAELKNKLLSIESQIMAQFQTQPLQKKPKLNAPCPCGSGRKFKKCCGKSQMNTTKQNR